ncbi:MAG: hypothetical protein H7A46_03530 [Verrucomicrobiales bacterium]|nr:hypothetical protein [Verrucomicrobiales bacterium]
MTTTNFTSGTLNLLEIMRWTIAQGWLPKKSTLNQVCFGVEMVSTDDTEATFRVTDFAIETRQKPKVEPAAPSGDGMNAARTREGRWAFRVVAASPAEEAEVDAVVRLVEDLKSGGHNIERVTRIRFASPTQATVDFLWSGGMHGGELELAKKDGAWVLVREQHFL